MGSIPGQGTKIALGHVAWPKERKISKSGKERSVINLYAPKNIGFKCITQKLAELKGKRENP